MRLWTNRSEYYNDLCEEIRLFLGLTEIELCEEEKEADVICTVGEKEAVCGYPAVRQPGVSVPVAPYPADDALLKKRNEKRAMKSALFRTLKAVMPEVQTPWGSLTGIRPTKLYRDLLAAGGEEYADRCFTEQFDVSEEKLSLAKEITGVQLPLIDAADPVKEADVYIGIPFCKSRCLYCSFASKVVGKRDELSPYLEVLLRDISHGAEVFQRTGTKLRCVYIGGGTPTVLGSAQLDSLLTHVEKAYGSLGKEITVEAGRPDTITEEKLSILRAHGVDRISVNPQTMNNETLRRIGRTHTAEETEACFETVRKAGFPVINMDLIAGLPGETAADFRESLRRVRLLKPENLTVHSLAIKRSSRLKLYLEQYPLPSPEETEEMIRMGRETAKDMGMVPYYMYRQKYMSGNLENTGYAVRGTECLYNVEMMEEVLSIMAHGGCGITKKLYPSEQRVERIPNPKEVEVYMNKLPLLAEQKNHLWGLD